MFALASATPMNLSSTEVICSRDTSLSSAIAMPSFCTSRASSCLSTLAASCSPRLISRMAARCVPARSSGLLAIRGDPILHDLRGAPRILPHQGSRGRDLLLETRRQLDGVAALSRQAHAIAVELVAVGARVGARRGLVSDFISGRSTRNATSSTSAGADDLLGELRDPGLSARAAARRRARSARCS